MNTETLLLVFLIFLVIVIVLGIKYVFYNVGESSSGLTKEQAEIEQQLTNIWTRSGSRKRAPLTPEKKRQLEKVKQEWKKERAQREQQEQREQPSAAPRPSLDPYGRPELSGNGRFASDIVGESHYQPALEKICGGRKYDSANCPATAVLIPDDFNPYDNQAVRVDINGKTVGHLSKKFARTHRTRLKTAGMPGKTVTCPAIIIGGWDRGGGDRGNFGVKLDLPTKYY